MDDSYGKGDESFLLNKCQGMLDDLNLSNINHFF